MIKGDVKNWQKGIDDLRAIRKCLCRIKEYMRTKLCTKQDHYDAMAKIDTVLNEVL